MSKKFEPSSNLFGLVLLGGKSTRMGQDKSRLNYHGKPQLDYMKEILTPFCAELFFSGRKEQAASSSRWISDKLEYADTGPLAGILSAMEEHPGKSWIVLAVDLPFVTRQTLQYLIENRDPQKIATVFRSNYDSLPEPLCAVWEGHSLAKIKELFANGIRCPRKILINSDVRLLEQKDKRWLDNVNTPEEFEHALKTIKHERS